MVACNVQAMRGVPSTRRRVAMTGLSLLAALALLTVPVASADHVTVTHDVPDSGRTYAGNPTSYGVLILDDAGAPAFHQDYTMTITWNDVTLFHAEGDAAHDYDGHNAFMVAFPGPGAYTVSARSGGHESTFTGVVADAPMRTGTAIADHPATQSPWVLSPTIIDEAGASIPHSDAWLTLVDAAGAPVTQVPLHQHDDPATVTIRAGSGQALLDAYQAYPASPDADFAAGPPLILDHAMTSPLAPTPGLATNAAPQNVVAEGTSNDGRLRIVLTVDPFNVVGADQPIRVGIVLLDEQDQPVPHVDVALEVTGPAGVALASPRLHDYDGVHDIMLRVPDLGDHTIAATASHGGATAAATLGFTVLPVLPDPAGASRASLVVEAQPPAADTCGPHHFKATATLGDGRPAAHDEVLAWLRHDDGSLVWNGKLHSHGPGIITWDLYVPPGPHTLTAWPYPTSPGTVHGPVIAVDVVGQECHGLTQPATAEGAADAATPVPALLGVTAVGLAGVLARRHRQT